MYVTTHAFERFLQRGGYKQYNKRNVIKRILNLYKHSKEVELKPAYKTLQLERGIDSTAKFYFSTKFILVVQGEAIVTILPMDFRKWRYVI